LRLRCFVETVAGAGRAVFLDYATEEGSIGMPGDAHRVLTVGAADLADKRRPESAGGPPMNVELLAKPNVLAYDEVGLAKAGTAHGTSLAAGFAAGLAASTLSAGAPHGRFLEAVGVQPGQVLRVPVQLREKRTHRP
jgi:hypothetical protein